MKPEGTEIRLGSLDITKDVCVSSSVLQSSLCEEIPVREIF